VNEINKKILADRKKDFDSLIRSRYYYSLGSEIYGGTAGLYDWGPVGCAIRKNI
jgi:glycyl-tRNA synthetase